jgi:hypothetical protein
VAADRELYGADGRLHTVHRVVIASLEAQFGPLAELNSVAIPWFSATFEGVRHELHFAAADPVRLAALENAGEVTLICPDHVIVSLGVEHEDGRARIDVLTVSCT